MMKKAGEILTATVITVGVETSVQKQARRQRNQRVSAG